MRLRDLINEMPLASYDTVGDFSRPGPFRGPDKKLVPHPVNRLNATKFFEKTPFDFRLFFSNIPGTGRYSEQGPVDAKKLESIFGKDIAMQILQGHEDTITVVYVGNKGDAKRMLTPWVMAHRFGHAVVAQGRWQGDADPAWQEAESHFIRTINQILADFYGKSNGGGRLKNELIAEYNALFNAIGTQRSSREGDIKRPYEFLYELFAQYLGTGKITLNPLPVSLGYGQQAWGKHTRQLSIRSPELRDDQERQHATEILARDMEILFNDVLGNSVGKIYVM